jgi:nickel superoxide dismutase
MLSFLARLVERTRPALPVSAHCDGPCGVYDPAQARVRAEAVLSMTKKIMDLPQPEKSEGNHDNVVQYLNTTARFIAIKEEEAQHCKSDLLILWTDYFKPEHLEAQPDLHDIFWQAAKLCSACKVAVNLDAAQELLATVEKIHGIFWASKGREVPYYTAS